MALVLGTNCGFVITAPSVDPSGLTTTTIDTAIDSVKDTAPATATTITEIGWWCNNATEETNFEVGVYTHDAGNDKPLNLLAGASQTNAKGTGAGWKVASGLSITITAGTIYWIAVQVDDTTTATQIDLSIIAGERSALEFPETTLTNPSGATATANQYYSIYAKWEAVAPPAVEEEPVKLASGWVSKEEEKLPQAEQVYLPIMNFPQALKRQDDVLNIEENWRLT